MKITDRIKWEAYRFIEKGQSVLRKPQNRLALMFAITASPTIACVFSGAVESLSAATSTPDLTILPDPILHNAHNPLVLPTDGCEITNITGIGAEGFPDAILDGARLETTCGPMTLAYTDDATVTHLMAPNGGLPDIAELDPTIRFVPEGAKFDDLCGLNDFAGPVGGGPDRQIDLGSGDIGIGSVVTVGRSQNIHITNMVDAPFPIELTQFPKGFGNWFNEGSWGHAIFRKAGDVLTFLGLTSNSCNVKFPDGVSP